QPDHANPVVGQHGVRPRTPSATKRTSPLSHLRSGLVCCTSWPRRLVGQAHAKEDLLALDLGAARATEQVAVRLAIHGVMQAVAEFGVPGAIATAQTESEFTGPARHDVAIVTVDIFFGEPG